MDVGEAMKGYDKRCCSYLNSVRRKNFVHEVLPTAGVRLGNVSTIGVNGSGTGVFVIMRLEYPSNAFGTRMRVKLCKRVPREALSEKTSLCDAGPSLSSSAASEQKVLAYRSFLRLAISSQIVLVWRSGKVVIRSTPFGCTSRKEKHKCVYMF